MTQKATKGDTSKVEFVIHVCDEANNVKQDFSCSRDLLVREMKYFADYLSAEVDKWEDVDISVHCDVQIFDWLMKYVKRNLPDGKSETEENIPMLEPTNVISILISSDFLKMDSLVEQCIRYCHENMTAIVATPCNMNCISDKIVTRIADLFTHGGVEAIKDRKDKFKSKLFCKKIEELFDPNFSRPYCPSNCADLFKCMYCEKLLTQEFHNKVECIGTRTYIDNRGDLHYHHARDVTWDVNDYIISLKSQVKYWRHVFWRLWGTANYLHCSTCNMYFPCTEFRNCRYHPQTPIFTEGENDDEKSTRSRRILGKYPCCDDPAIRFDPVRRRQGCASREHHVKPVEPPTMEQNSPENGSSDKERIEKLNSIAVLELLGRVKDVICTSRQVKDTQRFSSGDIFEDIVRIDPVGSRRILPSRNNFVSYEKRTTSQYRVESRSPSHRKSKGNIKRDEEEEDQSEMDEPAIVRVVINPAVKSKTHNDEYSNLGSWDTDLPVRLNQDVQREEDLKRMNDLLVMLCKERTDESRTSANEKGVMTNPEFAGGVYHRLESQLKSSVGSHRAQTAVSGTTSRSARLLKS